MSVTRLQVPWSGANPTDHCFSLSSPLLFLPLLNQETYPQVRIKKKKREREIKTGRIEKLEAQDTLIRMGTRGKESVRKWDLINKMTLEPT